MKTFFSVVLIILMLACNNHAGNSNGSGNDSDNTGNKKKEEQLSSSAGGNCGNSLLFHNGAEIMTSSYDGQGKETNKQVSTVTRVYEQGGMNISELEMKNTDAKGAGEKTFHTTYKCDGKLLYVDLAGFLSDNKQGGSIETSGLLFPLNVSVGETLPDADYSINMNMGGKTRKITSHIKERKVEAKESVTTTAGTFECYKISSVIEAEMPDMDERSKKIMEETKKRMGKSVMTFWYAPDVTIIKMELYMGDKLTTRSEVTGIKK